MPSKPFDATAKRLLEIDPPAWLACAGLTPPGPVRVVDSDLSTITSEADTIFAAGDPAEYLAHVELQSGRDRTLPRRLLHYNVLLNFRHDLPGGAGRLYAEALGIEHVIVGGAEIIRSGKETGALPGTILHSGRDTDSVPL